MLQKIVILLFLAAIVWCLVSAFWFLVRDKGEGERTVWRLTWRVGLSLVLFVMLYMSFLLGWLEPGRGPIGLMPPAVEQCTVHMRRWTHILLRGGEGGRGWWQFLLLPFSRGTLLTIKTHHSR